jgi:hypothetical protein
MTKKQAGTTQKGSKVQAGFQQSRLELNALTAQTQSMENQLRQETASAAATS